MGLASAMDWAELSSGERGAASASLRPRTERKSAANFSAVNAPARGTVRLESLSKANLFPNCPSNTLPVARRPLLTHLAWRPRPGAGEISTNSSMASVKFQKRRAFLYRG